jgi:hypothetical protein
MVTLPIGTLRLFESILTNFAAPWWKLRQQREITRLEIATTTD